MPTDRSITPKFSKAINREEYEKLHRPQKLQERIEEIQHLSEMEKERMKADHAERDADRLAAKTQDILTGRLQPEYTPDKARKPISEEKAAELAREEVDRENHNAFAAVDEREKTQIKELNASDPDLQKEQEALDALRAQKRYDRDVTRMFFDKDSNEQEKDQGRDR